MGSHINIPEFRINLDDFKKVEDLVFFDEPILSHFIKDELDYLFYYVDETEENEIVLIIRVLKEKLAKYLLGGLSLFDIIIKNNNYMIYVEINNNNHVVSQSFVTRDEIIVNHLPSKDSYLMLNPSENSYYFDIINNYKEASYLNSLKENATTLKVISKNSKYSHTIGFRELTNNVLKNIISSYDNFLKADFYNNFKEKYTNQTRLLSAQKEIAKYLEPRIVGLEWGSFEISLSNDKTMLPQQNREVYEWSKDIGDKYNDIVLDDDYDIETVKLIINNYSIEQREKIFSPIFKITKDKNLSLFKRDTNQKLFRQIDIKDEHIIEKIIPKKVESEKPKDYEIIQLIKVVDKNRKSNLIKIDDKTLFSSDEHAEAFLTKKNFLDYGFKSNFEIKIPILIDTNGSKVSISCHYKDIEYSVETDSFDESMRHIIGQIYFDLKKD